MASNANDLTIVTGAAGFIGRNAVAALNRQGNDNLVLVDNLGSEEKWRNLVGLRFDDVLRPNELWKWLESSGGSKVSGVVHLGACSATTETDADYLLENNYRFTQRLCTWCLGNDARFVYASSAATYGDGTLGFSDDDKDTVRLAPLNIYGYSKHLFDLWALRNGALDKVVGLKYFNVFGPYEDHKGDMRSVVTKAYEQISETGELALFKSYRDSIADGEQRRDFIYVDDAVAVTLHFLAERGSSGLFNCGTGISRTWLDLGRAIFSALGQQEAIRFIDMPDELQSRYQYFTEADTSRLRRAGYRAPFLSLEEGVEKFVRAKRAIQHV
jgi:ADP-L-glycero-D-manno-heptose 6-epimerase